MNYILARRRNAGFSLVEILLVLGVIAILAVAAFIIFPQVQASSRANQEAQNIKTIIAGVRNLYAIRTDYVGLETPVVNAAHIFPRSMNGGDFSSSATIRHLAGGDVKVEPRDADSRRFAVIYHDVPTEICVRLAQNFSREVDFILVEDLVIKGFGDSVAKPEVFVPACHAEELVDMTFI